MRKFCTGGAVGRQRSSNGQDGSDSSNAEKKGYLGFVGHYTVPRNRCFRASQSPSMWSSCCSRMVSGKVHISLYFVLALTVVISASLAFCSLNSVPATGCSGPTGSTSVLS